MARDILGEFGPDKMPHVGNNSGGVSEAKPINYKPPVGPSNINDPDSPGLHGTNHGNCGTQGKR